DLFQLINALGPNGRGADSGAQISQRLGIVRTLRGQEGQYRRSLFGCQPHTLDKRTAVILAPRRQKLADALFSNLVELVDGTQDSIGSLSLGHAHSLKNAVQHLAVVDADQVVAAPDPGMLQ